MRSIALGKAMMTGLQSALLLDIAAGQLPGITPFIGTPTALSQRRRA
ncbi:hypothetical protein FHT02_004248 [Sphingomonas xinjiangensis]|uniref:Uncharacterized protein n=1 Tax=Sphingomonas xinjiangensis TaxID=643568 RepID=A0A840YTE3_9SPHN|nr:hypothetical protein [Sphingomonas xinjiangensis]